MAIPTIPTLRVLLVTGGGWHDFAAGEKILKENLEKTGRYQVTCTHLSPQGVPEFAKLPGGSFDAVLIYTQCAGAMPQDQEDGLIRFVENGGTLVGLHCANDSWTGSDRYMQLIGSRFRTHAPGTFEFEVTLSDAAKQAGHPMVVRTDNFAIRDEHYLIDPKNDFDVFATSFYGGKPEPMGYTRKQGKGTVVYLANGHYPASLSNRYFLRFVDRALRIGVKADTVGNVRAGIIGYGGAFNMGKYHADAINAQLGMKTVAVCDLDPKRTEQAKTELGQQILTTNKVEEMMAMREVDMVVVILPHNIHGSVCAAAARAGKHVVTEKPFCITIEEADEMLAAAKASGTMLSCFHNRRWDGDFLRLLGLVRDGAIGNVYHIEAASAGYGRPRNWWRSSKEISGGTLYDWGAHYCDWTLNIANKRIASVSGLLQKRYWHQSDNEDYAKATIRFEDGTSAEIEQGSLAAISRPGWRILGDTGGLSNGGPHQEITMVQIVNGVRQESKLPGGPGTALNYYQNVANHLILGERLVVTAEQARRAIGVLRLAELSHMQGGIPLPLTGEDKFNPDYLFPW
ncbi:MAG: Gfo/Idh/MocA family oxidoreductase [Phycisphaeraceae bacterium]|nr:Gfo/Idh/MocA family oxidoreductase [Phycisphaeraceae bacterium]